MTTIKSYKLNIHYSNNGRQLTQIKSSLLEGIYKIFKQSFNYISKDNYSGKNYWTGQSSEDKKLIELRYNKQFQRTFTAGYAQNLYKFANDKYNTSMITFFKQKKFGGLNTSKSRSKKPYFDEIEFPLDGRMLSNSKTSKHFLKDKSVNNLYWLSINNPYQKTSKLNQKLTHYDDRFVDYKRQINLPLYIYPEVQQYLDLGIKHSFTLGNGYIKINFTFSDLQVEQLFKEQKKLDKVAIDFGKYLSTYNSKGEYSQYDLSKFYRSIKKIQGQIQTLQSQLDNLKNSKNFRNDYYNLKTEIQKLYTRILEKRKHTYNFIANKLKQAKTVIREDLTFTAIEKTSKSYKGRTFNKFINVMGKGIWKQILDYKLSLAGSQQVIVNAAYTSQQCQSCRHISRTNRSGRKFTCKECGFTFDADLNAAHNIYEKGLVYLQNMKIS